MTQDERAKLVAQGDALLTEIKRKRALFENICADRDLRMNDDGQYRDSQTQHAWHWFNVGHVAGEHLRKPDADRYHKLKSKAIIGCEDQEEYGGEACDWSLHFQSTYGLTEDEDDFDKAVDGMRHA